MFFCNVICVTSSECGEGYVDRRKGKYAGGVYARLRNERVLGVVNVSVALAHSSGAAPFLTPSLTGVTGVAKFSQI